MNQQELPSISTGSSIPVVPRKFLYPFILVTTLFALWGFANDVTNPLVKVFKDVFLISNFQSSLVQFAFYGGYATMAIPAALVIRKYSFKTGIIVGFAPLCNRCIALHPSKFEHAVLHISCGVLYPDIRSGISGDEPNPYILSMGSEETATRRLNLAQAFNPMGSLVGMFVASQLILPNLEITSFRDNAMRSHPEYKTMSPAKVDPLITSAWRSIPSVNRWPTRKCKPRIWRPSAYHT